MAVDISNGGLTFSSDLDPSGFAEGADAIKKKEAEIRNAVVEGTKKQQFYSDEMLRSTTLARYNAEERIKGAAKAKIANESVALSISQLNEELKKQILLQQNSTDPLQVKRLNQTIQETEGEISRLKNVGRAGFDDFGNKIVETEKKTGGFASGVGKAFGAVRKLAYILPGVGIAGILAFAAGPILEYISKLDLFKGKIDQLKLNVDALNEVNKNALKTAGEQTSSLKLLYSAATDVTLSTKERTKAAQELKKEFPTAFANSKTQAILNGEEKKTFDDLTKSILENARAKAAKDKLAEIESKRLAIAEQKQKIKNANANENKRATNVSVDAFTGPTQGQASGSVGITKQDVIAANNARAQAALKDQEIYDQRLKAQSEFLIKYVGKEKLVDAIISGGGKESKTPIDETLKKAQDLQRKIDGINAEYSRKSLTKDEAEIQAIKDKFKKISDEVAKFNADPKNKYKVDGSGLKGAENTAINDAKYRQGTDDLKTSLEEQKKIYSDYEAYKSKLGEEEANKRFKNELELAKKTNDTAAKELAGLLTITATGGNLTGTQQERYDVLINNLKELKANEKDINQRAYIAAFQAAKTHAQKLIDIETEYQNNVKALGENATVEQLAVLKKSYEDKKQAENASNLDTERAYADLFASFETSTKEKVRVAIEAEKQILKAKLASGEISQQDYNSRLNALNNANAKFVTSTDGAFKKVADAFKKYKDAKEGIEKGDAFKNLASEASNAAFLIQGVFSGITDGLASLGVGTDKYTQQTFKNIEGLLGGIGDLGKGLASGNPIDVVKGSIEILSNAIQLFNTKDKKLEKKIDGYKAQLKALQAAYKALDQQVKYAVGEDVYRDQAAQIRNLQQQQQALINARNAESQKKKSDAGKIADYNSQIQDIKYQIQDLQKSIQDTLLQTNFKDFSNQLADALSSAFAAGEDGTKALDQSFDQMIQNMIKNALKLKLLEGPVNDVLNQLADYMKTHNNDATGFDFDAAKKKLEAAGKKFNDALAGFGDLFKNTVDPTANNNTLSGAIKGITADQADILAGQFGGMRLAQLENNSILRINHAQLMAMNTQKLNNLIQIEINTRGTKENTDRLYYIQNSLESLDKKISSDALLRGAGLKGP